MILHLGLNFVSILVVNNNPLEDFPKRFLFWRENNQLQEYMYGQEATGLSIQIQWFVQWAFLLAIFFQKYFFA